MATSLFEELREKAARRKIPLVCHFDLTYRCNLRCIHCYVVGQTRSELDADEVKDILGQLADAGTLYLTLSGGELFVRKDVLEIASYARKLNFVLRLLTSGTLINEDRATQIASLRPELVGVSIYSTTPEIHDRITGCPGSFERARAAVVMLRARGVRVKLSTVIMKENVDHYRSVYELARAVGADFQADYRITPQNDKNTRPLSFHVDDEDMRRILADPIFSRVTDPEPEEAYSGVFEDIPCGAGHMAVYISPYGDVYPCVQLPIPCGNLREAPLSKIWNSSPRMSEVRSIRIGDLDVCRSCTLRKHCRLCIGLSYLEEQSVRAPLKRACKEARILSSLALERR